MIRNNIGDILDFVLLKRLMVFAKPYKSQFLIASIAAILLSFLGPIRPILINYAVDNYIIIQNQQKLFEIIILIFLLLIAEGLVQFFYIYLSTWIGQNVIKDLRIKLFKHIINLRMKYFDNTPIGTLVTRSISDIETIAAIFSEGLLVIIAELLKLIVVVIIMFYTNSKLALISLTTIPFLLLATSWFKRSIKIAFQEIRDKVSELNTFVQEHIVGMRIVQIFNREDAEYKKFYKINNFYKEANLRSIFYYAVFFPIVEILSATSIGLIVWYGAESILLNNSVTIGEIIAFILFIHMMFRPIRQLADRFNILQMGIVGASRVFKVLDTRENIEDNGEIELTDVRGKIGFNNVDFSYKDNELVLRNLDFDIEEGCQLALVGRTGAGKTSIINILNRFYEIQNGGVTIDGIDIKNIKLNNLRNNISMIQQEVFLFSDTILNNITLYNDAISRQRVIDASKEIGIHHFIESLPGEYDYTVGERGITLSSGQRQLIAFLRVYIRDPRILILDEATSSVDTLTEQILQKALIKLSKNRTTIIIAHRLSTIINSDKIIYLKEGKVHESGTHQELFEQKGDYYKMYATQEGHL